MCSGHPPRRQKRGATNINHSSTARLGFKMALMSDANDVAQMGAATPPDSPSSPTTSTPIDGLVVCQLTVHGDNRGWFKENWAGEPPMRVEQNNVSFNASAGATRGMHAEPWDKYVSVATGRVYGAWVDLREGSPTHGEKFGIEIGPDTAVFVPRGVANGFQALEEGTTYIYLCNARWSPTAQYAFCSYKEIDWPLEPTDVSAKDEEHPALVDAPTVAPRNLSLIHI